MTLKIAHNMPQFDGIGIVPYRCLGYLIWRLMRVAGIVFVLNKLRFDGISNIRCG